MEISKEARQSSCYLLDIPVEVRLAIYGNLVPRQLDRYVDLILSPLRANSCYIHLGTNKQITCLLLICKQINEEVAQMYMCDSLTLRMRPTLNWCHIPGPDPMVFLNCEPLQNYFEDIIKKLLSSKEDARIYLEFLRNNEEIICTPMKHESKTTFPEPVNAYDYPHPQFGLILTALSVYKPVNTMFMRVQKLEISDDLLGIRYPYLLRSWITQVYPNLRCLSILQHTSINKYESDVPWVGLDVDFWKFKPNNDVYGWLDLADWLLERDIVVLRSGLCEYELKCHDPRWKDHYEEPYFHTHKVQFFYTLDCQHGEIIAVELHNRNGECVCKFESRLKTNLDMALDQEGLKLRQGIFDNVIQDLLGLRRYIPLCEDAGWDRPLSCPVIDPSYS